MALDIRWIQRFGNFRKALKQLGAAINLSEERPLSSLEMQGLIQAFEFTFEMAWLTLKDYLQDQGEVSITGSKDTFRLSFKRSLIADGDVWMEMIQSRIKTVHSYDEAEAESISKLIKENYYPLFIELEKRLENESLTK